MAVALQVVSVDNTRRKKRVTYKPTFSGNYVTNGDTIDATVATDPNFKNARIPAVAPEYIEVNGAPGGYDIEGVVGAGNNNSKLKVFQAGSGNAAPIELAAGAYPAAVSGDLNVTLTFVYPQAKS